MKVSEETETSHIFTTLQLLDFHHVTGNILEGNNYLVSRRLRNYES
jgi:hypothetical protein